MARSDAERERLRQTFDAAAERYDRVRPGYPDELVDRLVELARLSPGDRVLELGCGPGQLTRSLVERGFAVTAVELSPELSAVARRNVPEVRTVLKNPGRSEQVPRCVPGKAEEESDAVPIARRRLDGVPANPRSEASRFVGCRLRRRARAWVPRSRSGFFSTVLGDHDRLRELAVAGRAVRGRGRGDVVHWIDPAVRFAKSAAALRPGGALGIISTGQVEGGSSEFFAEVQRCYRRWLPDSSRPGFRLTPAESVADDDDLAPGGHFSPAGTARCVREIPYSSEDYIDLLLTYSDHLALPPETQAGLLGCIRSLIDTEFGGRVIKAYLFRLAVGRVSPPT